MENEELEVEELETEELDEEDPDWEFSAAGKAFKRNALKEMEADYAQYDF